MKLTSPDDFIKMSPNQRDAFLAFWGIERKKLTKIYRVGDSSISMALRNYTGMSKLLQKISVRVYKMYLKKSVLSDSQTVVNSQYKNVC